MASFTSKIISATKRLSNATPSTADVKVADKQASDATSDVAAAKTFLAAQCDFESIGGVTIGQSRYRYGVQIGFESSEDSTTALLRSWSVHEGNFKPVTAFIIRTADGNEIRLEPNLKRADVMRHLNVPAEKRDQSIVCAARSEFDSKGRSVTLLLETPDGVAKVGVAKRGPAQVLMGTNNWLFLSGDSNDSVGQFTTPHVPSQKWFDGWDTYFSAFDALQQTGKAGRTAFLIAPSKETLFRDYHPLPFGGRTLVL